MSADYEIIIKKIQGFVQKFYVNEIIKGVLIFITVALLYLLSILLLEDFLWFSITTRTVLFWTFIVFSVYLFIRFIGISLAKLIKLGKQISALEASKIIGNYFPEVDDQLINLLQLKSSSINSDLLEASIAQKSKELSPIPFKSAINFKKNLLYAKYALIPVLLFLLFSFFKGFSWYKTSLSRVVNYNIAYEPPAPFHFKIINEDLNTLEHKDFTLLVTTQGKIVPNQIQINYNGANYFLNKVEHNRYSYIFSNLKDPVVFSLQSGDIKSKKYDLTINEAPSILDFRMKILPPKHVNLSSRIVYNSGTAVVPEGSRLDWIVNSENAKNIDFVYNDSTYTFKKQKNFFQFNKRINKNIDYQITSSNEYVSNFDKLDFNIEVIKDKHPLINVLSKKDSLDNSKQFFYGRLSDDYGLSQLRVVYFIANSPKDKEFKSLAFSKGTSSEFTFQFPNDIQLEESKKYSFYFEVFDNDSFNGAKSSKSETYNYTVLSNIEESQNESNYQEKQLDNFEKTIEQFEESEVDLEQFTKLQKQSLSVSFKEKEKLENILEKQFSQQKKLEELSEKLKKTLDKLTDPEVKNPTKEELERTKRELAKNKKIIEDIKKAMEKLSPKELKDKVDELKKENKKVTKNLSQILELTKRHYVIDKHQRIVKMLELLSEKQNAESLKENNLENQKQINKEFQIIREELDDLRDHNAKLRKPMVLDDDSVYEGKIESKLKETINNIEKSNSDLAKKKQSVSSVMMKNLADKMSKTAAAGASEQLEDDKESLRQILDNLVLFSINQEDNMDRFNTIATNNPNYSKHIRTQNRLREHFNHIDDSLFAVSSRNPKIGTKINSLISDITYNMDSSLESLTDNKVRGGVTKLRFAITNSNDLAVMLSSSLKQLNQRLKPGSGESKKKQQGFQLPDIIKKQESLNKAFQKALQAGQKKPGDSKKEQSGGQKKIGSSGEDGKKGDNGKQGSEGKQGQSGQSGEQGKPGEGSSKGTKGESGNNGFGIGQGNKGQGSGKQNSEGEGNSDGNGKPSTEASKKGTSKSNGREGKNGKPNGKESKDSDDKGKSEKESNSKNKSNTVGKGKGKGDKRNSKEGKTGGTGNGSSEDENDYEQLFEIYKQQQNLRNQLEDKMSKEGVVPRTEKRILDQMKQVENELIEKGFNTETLNRMLNLKHQLFKLDKAQFKQEKEKKRKSKANTEPFISKDFVTPEQIKKYFNATEILNRDALPLQPNFKKKVNEYFNK